MIYFYRFTNGNEQIWTYMVKESHDHALKGRIDYVLGTPSLSNAISDAKHIFHEYELTDHATSYISIDLPPQIKDHMSLELIQHYCKIQTIKLKYICQKPIY